MFRIITTPFPGSNHLGKIRASGTFPKPGVLGKPFYWLYVLSPPGTEGVYAQAEEEVEPGEAETRQVGKVGNLAGKPGNGEEQFQGGKAQHQNRGAEGKDAPDVNDRVRKEYRVGKLHREDRPGRTQEDDKIAAGKVINGKGKDPGKTPGKQVKEDEFLASHPPFHLGTEDKKGEHVEKNMAEPGVEEHVGQESPEGIAGSYHGGYHGETAENPALAEDLFREKGEDVETDKPQNRAVVTVAEGPP
jgi:hypothetical protein